MASSQDPLREQHGTPIWISYSVNLERGFHITYYVCTGMLSLDFHDLLVDETKHELDLAVKQGLDFLACFSSRLGLLQLIRATYCVNIILESSIESSG